VEEGRIDPGNLYRAISVRGEQKKGRGWEKGERLPLFKGGISEKKKGKGTRAFVGGRKSFGKLLRQKKMPTWERKDSLENLKRRWK